MIVLAGITFVVCLILLLFSIFYKEIPPYSGAIISRCGEPTRSHGPGLAPVIPVLEEMSELYSLKKRSVPVEVNAETEEDDPVKLKMSFEYEPDPKNLIRHLSFEEKQLEESLSSWVKSFAIVSVRTRKTDDDVYDNLREIQSEIHGGFIHPDWGVNGKTLEEYYAIEVHAVKIDGPELPAKLVEKAVEIEAQKKENERKKLEMDSIDERINTMREQDPSLTYDGAFKRLQVQDKIVPEEHKVYGVDAQTLSIGGGALKMFMSLLRKNGGKRGKQK